MADEQSTNDTTVAEAPAEVPAEVDTSTTDEAPDTDVDLEDIEVSLDDDETEESDESEESPNSEETETEEQSNADDTEEAEAEPEQSDNAEEESDADRKARNQEYAQKRIAERQDREKQKEIAQAKEDVRIEQYLKEAEGDESELTLRKAEVERLLLQRERVAMNEEKLHIGIDRAISEIDLFRTGSPEVKQELVNAVDDFVAMYVDTDKNGNPIQVRGDIRTFLQKKADSIRRIQGVGVRQAVKDKQAVRSKTMTVPTRAPKEEKVDKDLADFDSVWD